MAVDSLFPAFTFPCRKMAIKHEKKNEFSGNGGGNEPRVTASALSVFYWFKACQDMFKGVLRQVKESTLQTIMEGRSSKACKANRGKGRESHRQIKYSGPSYSDLPNNILENIIMRLSIKSILAFKCVCKSWYNLVSDPEFANLHFSQSRICPLLRKSDASFQSRMMFLVEAEINDFECQFNMCFESHSKLDCFSETKVELLLPSLQKIINEKYRIHSRLTPEKRWDMEDLKYRVVNSCSGLLCLSDPTDNDPVIICNPITGEFINLPMSKVIKNPVYCTRDIVCGFGFCPATNQYKVIRMFTRWVKNGNRSSYSKDLVAEVNILGTQSWKNLGYYPESSQSLYPTYVGGCVYWLSLYYVIFFDFEKECFGSILVPPLRSKNRHGRVRLGVLRGELCICEAYINDITIWTLKDNGAEKEWSVVLCVPTYMKSETWPIGAYQPIRFLNDGSLLMFHPRTNSLICKDPAKLGNKTLKFQEAELKLELILHAPSFISLKHLLAGHNVNVFNVQSSCGELKLDEEEKIESEMESKNSEWSESQSEGNELLESDSEEGNLEIDSSASEEQDAESESEEGNLEIDSSDSEEKDVESDSENGGLHESDSEESDSNHGSE